MFYRIGEKKNNIIDIESSIIYDNFIKDIIINYKNLIILKEKKENLIDKLIYINNQFFVYLIQIKNDPKKLTRKLSNFKEKLFKKISNL